MSRWWSCLRCENAWEGRLATKPVQCPRCKSPYWDRERQKDGGRNGIPKSESREEVAADRDKPSEVSRVEIRKGAVPVLEPSFGVAEDRVGIGEMALDDEPAVEMCPYTEYVPDTGETVACGLPLHSGKVRHGAWSKVG